MRRAFVTTLTALTLLAWSGQTHPTSWFRTYGTEANDSGYSFEMDTLPDGTVVMGGSTGPFLAHDLWLLNVDGDGNVLWERTYDTGKDETLRDLDVTSDGGIVVVARVDGGVLGKESLILKTDAAGNLEWRTRIADAAANRLYALVEVAEGGFVGVGASDVNGQSATWWLVRLDAAGGVSWEQTFEGPDLGGRAYDIAETADGGYVVVGFRGMKASVIRLDADGNLDCSSCWQKTYEWTDTQGLNTISPLADGGFITSGYGHDINNGVPSDAVIMKLAEDGSVEWARTYGSEWTDGVGRIVALEDGSFALEGGFGTAEYYSDGWGLKVDASGTILWQWRYGTVAGSTEQIGDIVALDSGGFMLGGFIHTVGSGQYDIVGVRVEEDGTIPPTCAYVTPTDASSTLVIPTVVDLSLSAVPVVRPDSHPLVAVGSVEPAVIEFCAGITPPQEPSAGGTPLTLDGGVVVEAVDGVTAYNVYVDQLGSWYSPTPAEGTACTVVSWTENPDGTLTLDVPVPAGSWVAVSASNAGGESSVGRDSSGTERKEVGTWPLCDLGP